MELTAVIIGFLIGILLIVKGGDFFVDAAAWLAEISGIPKLIVGATVVSVATTLPELLVSLMAAVQGKVDMSVGNAVGSVTANIGLIMAISLICMPGAIRRKDYMVKSLSMLGAAAIIVVSGRLGEIGLLLSAALLVIFAFFITENVSAASAAVASKGAARVRRAKPSGREVLTNVVKFVLGAAGIVIGAQLLVDNGSELARFAGVSERVIGVTIIAVGTSLPELVTTITAIVKKQAALSVGNILGANIMDLTMIMPLCALVSGKALPISPASARLDLPACLLVGLVAVVPALLREKFSRWQGLLLLAIYAGYLYLTCFAAA